MIHLRYFGFIFFLPVHLFVGLILIIDIYSPSLSFYVYFRSHSQSPLLITVITRTNYLYLFLSFCLKFVKLLHYLLIMN